MLTALDDAARPLVAAHRRRDGGFKGVLMSLSAIGASRAGMPGVTPGYRDAIAGLQSFGELSRTLGQHRDAVLRNVTSAAAYPQPAYASPTAAGTALGAAVAAFVGSESGRAAIERAVSAAGTFVKGLLANGGPTQLPLPFE
jgi:hypothetical protein